MERDEDVIHWVYDDSGKALRFLKTILSEWNANILDVDEYHFTLFGDGAHVIFERTRTNDIGIEIVCEKRLTEFFLEKLREADKPIETVKYFIGKCNTR